MKKYYEGVITQQHDRARCSIPETGKTVRIGMNHLHRALHGDTVLLKLSADGKHGFVQKVLSHNPAKVTGQLHQNGNTFFVKAFSANYLKDFHVQRDHATPAKDGDVVEVEVCGWEKTAKSPSARVLRVLPSMSPSQVLLAKSGGATSFPDEVLSEARTVTVRLDESRIDLTGLDVFTIDPDNAQDLDDGLSIEKTELGYRVGVHIADVSSVVKPGTKTDQEAYRRGLSAYLPDMNVPMLPEATTNMCSLLPNKRRNCVSVLINVDNDWNVITHHIFKSVVVSREQYSYEGAEREMGNAEAQRYTDMNLLHMIGKKLRNRFFPDELVLNTPQTQWVMVDGEPERLVIKRRTAAHDLVQSWMLLTNMFVTNRIEEAGVKHWVYRTHGEVDAERLGALQAELAQIGFEWDADKTIRENMAGCLRRNTGAVASEILLRYLPSARYSTRKSGHYAIGTGDYTHFTSPIRRYSDLIVQRILINTLEGRKVNEMDLESVCEHLVTCERKADRMERNVRQVYMQRFAKGLRGEVKGVVLNSTRKGAFVRTEFMLDGWIPATKIDGAWDEQSRMWRGTESYRIGDPVRVRIGAVDWKKNEIELE